MKTIEQRTMIPFPWIIGPFLMILFYFPAAAAEGKPSSFFTVQVGDKITLPCENMRKDQKNCDRTTWMYRNFMQERIIFENGQINKDAPTESGRLSLTANCCLVIKTIALQDAGLYTCKQHRRANQDSRDSLVDVSVIRVSKQELNGDVSLHCSLQEHNYCTHTVDWEYNQKMPSGVEVLSYSCQATVTFPTSLFSQKSNIYELLKCKVTDKTTGEVQLFSFRPRSFDEEDAEKDATTTATTLLNTATLLTTRKPAIAIATTAGLPSVRCTSLKGNARDNRKYSEQREFIYFVRCIVVPVGLAALLMLVGAVNMWAKTKEHRTQLEQEPNKEDDNNGVYENIKEFKLQVPVRFGPTTELPLTVKRSSTKNDAFRRAFPTAVELNPNA